MSRGARTIRRGQRCHDGVGVCEMAARARDHRSAGFVQSWRAASDGSGIGAGDAGIFQRFARQIETPDAGILIEVAQDVGQLQRAAEMMGELLAVRRDPCRTP